MKTAKRSLKRGGDRVHVPLEIDDGDLPELGELHGQTPDEILDRMWRVELVERALESLEQELEASGRQLHFEVFRDYYLSPGDELDHKGLAERHGITTATVSRDLRYVKNRYRTHLRSIVRETVSSQDELEEELRWLFGSESP